MTSPSLRFSKKFQTGGSTSRLFSQRVKTLASRSPSASKSSTEEGGGGVSSGARPGWVLKRLATKARFRRGLPATRAEGVRYFLQPILSAFWRT